MIKKSIKNKWLLTIVLSWKKPIKAVLYVNYLKWIMLFKNKMYIWLEIHKRETFYFQHYFKLFKHFETKLFSAVSQISRYVPLKEFHEEVANYEYVMIICIAFLAILFFYIVYIYFFIITPWMWTGKAWTMDDWRRELLPLFCCNLRRFWL